MSWYPGIDICKQREKNNRETLSIRRQAAAAPFTCRHDCRSMGLRNEEFLMFVFYTQKGPARRVPCLSFHQHRPMRGFLLLPSSSSSSSGERETRIDVICAAIVSTCCVLDGRIVPVRRSVTSSKTHLVDRDVTTENVVDVLRVVSDHILDGLPLVSGNVIIINLFSLSEKFISSKQDVFVYIILLKENKTYSSSVERRRVICRYETTTLLHVCLLIPV